MVWRITSIEDEEQLLASTGLGINSIINTDQNFTFSSHTELTNDNGQVVRFKPNAEFMLESTVFGTIANYYGELALFGVGTYDGKYRTSCYVRGSMGNTDVHIKNIAPNIDKFSVYRGILLITEYDENNRNFVICSVNTGESATLEADDTKPMRERYKVLKMEKIAESEYYTYIKDFGPPKYPIGF